MRQKTEMSKLLAFKAQPRGRKENAWEKIPGGNTPTSEQQLFV